MNPSFTAFADELLLIKQAESDEPERTPEPASAAPMQDEETRPFKSEFAPLAKERFKNSLIWGLGHGLGTGAGMLVGEKVIPKVLPVGWSEATKRNVGFGMGGLGAVGALALWESMRRAAKDEEDVLRRHR